MPQGKPQAAPAAGEALLPPGYGEAAQALRSALARCEAASIAKATLVAALMTELMPRLLDLHGPRRGAQVLGRLAAELDPAPSALRQ